MDTILMVQEAILCIKINMENLFMEEQADSIQQGYQDGLKFKLQQIKEINNEHSKT
jgi:hypothetical protein